MIRREDPLEAAAKGAVSGLVGTAAITAGMKGIPILMEQLGLTPPKLPAATKSGNGQKTEEPTEKLAEKVATNVLETSLEEDTKEVAGQAIHWGYSATWGAVYGLAQNQLQLSPHLHGLLFGALVATVASTLVPAYGPYSATNSTAHVHKWDDDVTASAVWPGDCRDV